jgi:hypothetical protein
MLSFIPKTSEELHGDFIGAFERLVRAGKAFDEGHFSEAPRIAAEVYLFVHDHGRSATSLLTHVGRKKTDFIDTAVPLNSKNLLAEAPPRYAAHGVERLRICRAARRGASPAL